METQNEDRITCNNPDCEKIISKGEIDASAAGYCATCEAAALDAAEAARLASAVPVKVIGTAEVEAVKALLKFISKDETRYALQFLGVFPDFVAATDGHKLLKVKRTPQVFDSLVYGRSYSVAKNGKEFLLVPEADAGQFPNVDGVTPKADKATFYFSKFNNGNGKSIGLIAYHLAKNNVQMDLDNFKALPEANWNFYGTLALSPVLAVSPGKGYTAVFMPMRGDNVDKKGDKIEKDYTPLAVEVKDAPAVEPEAAPVADGALAGADVVAAVIASEVTGAPLPPEIEEGPAAPVEKLTISFGGVPISTVELKGPEAAPVKASPAWLSAMKGGAK